MMHKYGDDYKLIFVGDATMSPYEILQPGGSVEYTNEEAGAVWLQRMLDTYPQAPSGSTRSPSGCGTTAIRSRSSATSWDIACSR